MKDPRFVAFAPALVCGALMLARCTSGGEKGGAGSSAAASAGEPVSAKDAEGWRLRQEAFRREWKEVEAKYPNVATAFRMQESIAIRALAKERLENGPAVTYTRALPYDISILSARLQKALARLAEDSDTKTIVDPPPCTWRQSTGPGDVERAMEAEMKCLEKAP